MNEITKYYECVERKYRPESYRLMVHRAEDENEVLRERIAELRRQLEAHGPRRRNNPLTE